jgi:putative oxidoreductase
MTNRVATAPVGVLGFEGDFTDRVSPRYAVPVGRALFALIFVLAGPGHFTSPMIQYAAAQGVPLAGVLVPLAGIIAFVGGLAVAFGYHTRAGAWLLVLFLVPVTVKMHAFWGVADPQAAALQQAMFMKNVSMLGAALLLAYFGGGPYSLDARRLARDAEPRAGVAAR